MEEEYSDNIEETPKKDNLLIKFFLFFIFCIIILTSVSAYQNYSTQQKINCTTKKSENVVNFVEELKCDAITTFKKPQEATGRHDSDEKLKCK